MTPLLQQPATPHNYLLMQEAFLRRAAGVGGPFMLKGSYVMRQYLDHPEQRIPQDLDWVCLTPAQSVEQMRSLLNAWAIAVTEQPVPDGFAFQSFRENEFWRMIDYAMSDDFPTVNTDIGVWLPGYSPTTAWPLRFQLDMSFNLLVEPPPVPLTYRPFSGEPFLMPLTCSLALQVAWKLHQTLVRLRYKDITDLIALLTLPEFDAPTRAAALQALVDECHADQINPQGLHYYATAEATVDTMMFDRRETTTSTGFIGNDWNKSTNRFNDIHFAYAHQLGPGSKRYTVLPELFADFQAALNRAGITAETLAQLPVPVGKPKRPSAG